MNGLSCIKCTEEFTLDSRLPLVLPCGDSVCMKCVLFLSTQSQNFLKCSVCSLIYEVTNIFIKELPKNKALISLISSANLPTSKSGPNPRILFANTPEPKRISASPDKNYGYFTPSTYHSPLPFSSPNSVAIKCARLGCKNDRFFLNGEVWNYCSINCRDSCKFDDSTNNPKIQF